ncbi:MAG: hypothetical protein O2820_05300 [Planctomycetota bacterium]|nr:hypothetical protein [Planctomycetota bacterium]MDA1248621.1 hypothetical protein [Planctomycetota bacterium]
MSDDSDDNWLNASVINCPSCAEKLFRVDHSSFYDEWHLPCGACAKWAEVSSCDPRAAELRSNVGNEFEHLIAAIEESLKPCTCGGRFNHAAARRCFKCGSVVVAELGVDVSIYTGCENEDRDPTDEEQSRFDRFEAEFARRTNLWR